MFKLVLAGILAATLSYTPPGNLHGYWIVVPGDVEEDSATQPHVKTGTGCWALHSGKEGYTLDPTTISIEEMSHPRRDGSPGSAFKVAVAAEHSGARLMIGGLKNPIAGKVKTASDTRVALVPGVQYTVALENTLDELIIKAEGNPSRGSEPTKDDFLRYKIVLERAGEAPQILPSDFFVQLQYHDHVQIVWAGDLDRDDRIDLVLSYPYGESGANGTVLMLSSERRLNSLLHPVAKYVYGGC